jgi:hypothetical protein
MSSAMIKRMLGGRPEAAAGAAAGVAFCACASALDVSVAAATKLEVPKSILRRLIDPSLALPAVSDDMPARSVCSVLPLISLSLL